MQGFRLGAWPAEVLLDLRIGFIFLTRLPLRQDGEIDGPMLSRAARVYPLVGLSVGLLGAAAYSAALGIGLPPLPAAVIAVSATIVFTGAFHEDGFGDVADGFGGAFERERKLEIMKDSRVGTYGALALMAGFAFRVSALAALADAWLVAGALIAAHAASRALIPLAMRAGPLARRTGLAAYATTPTLEVAATATGLAAIIAILALPPLAAVAGLVLALLTGGGILLLARRQIGGYTGDVLGAIQQGGEIAVLLAAAAVSSG
jgi:adenosylcobinamide-GDP ribazoletransferase